MSYGWTLVLWIYLSSPVPVPHNYTSQEACQAAGEFAKKQSEAQGSTGNVAIRFACVPLS